MRVLKWFFLVVDFSFILYFSATAIGIIPIEYAYSDYTNPILVSWNWSFLPLDIVISLTGLSSIYLHRKGRAEWKSIAFTRSNILFWVDGHIILGDSPGI